MAAWKKVRAAVRLLAHQLWSWGSVCFTVGFFSGSAMTIAGIIDLRLAEYLVIGAIVLLTLRGCFDRELLGGKSRIEQTTIRAAIVIFACLVGSGSFYLLESKRPQPSVVFLAPYGTEPEKDSPWMFAVQQRGPENIFNTSILFGDRYRAIKHGGVSTNPDQIKKESFVFEVPEIDAVPNIGPPPGFWWSPLDPNHQEYDALIRHRAGMIYELIWIERVDGEWTYSIVANEVHIGKRVFECQDQKFPHTIWPMQNPVPCIPSMLRKR